MLKRSSFKPRVYTPPPKVPASRGRIVRMERISDMFTSAIKEPAPVRDEPYRRLVASLECYHCRIWEHSQAAHPNSGKGKGVKLSDLYVFPMCTVAGNDCHRRFDQYEIVPKGDAMAAYEQEAHIWTVKTLISRGMWPSTRPMPEILQSPQEAITP